MATLTLYKDKLNGVSSAINSMVKSSKDVDTQLGVLKNTLQGVNNGNYDLSSAVSNISSSSKTENEKVEDLKKLDNSVSEFITTAVSRDEAAADAINKEKEDFYSEFSYLKPDCEKNPWEKIKSGVAKTWEWCCENWKLVVVIVVAIVCVIALCTGIGGPLVLALAANILKGMVCLGLSGGIISALMGGSFIEGFLDGAIFGIIFGVGVTFGGVIAAKYGCNSLIAKVIGMTSKITGVMSISMITFDIAALIAPENNPISQLNSKANSNDVYKFFKNATFILSTLTGGMSKGISNSKKCFIAGTLILTAEGLKNIEDIKPGDLVLSTDTDTMETGYKPVVETYVRKTKELIQFIIGGKKVVTTPEHPFYVVGAGFVAAALLCIGTPLVDVEGKELPVEQIYREDLGQEEVSVYNFQVEDWHTYHVSDAGVLVHNAGAGYGEEGKGPSESCSVRGCKTLNGGANCLSNIVGGYTKNGMDWHCPLFCNLESSQI